MRVVLDNNVLVSAVISPLGIPGAIYQAWRRAEFQLLVSAPLLSELVRVLAYPRIVKLTRWSPTEQDVFITLLAEDAILVSPDQEVTLSRDPTDNRILEAAAAGAADYIVSGDKDLLVLGEFEGIPIVSPTRFVTILSQSG